jgi:transcriptional repressor NrdR
MRRPIPFGRAARAAKEPSMKCPHCGWTESRVTDSRDQGGTIHRRRKCERCSQRFSTVERVVLAELTVIKRDGRREPFKGDKLMEGLRRAAQKRPIPVGQLEAIVDEIEAEVQKLGQMEIPTGVIGEMVMERLRRLDDIAYIRFASVYRSYPDLLAMRQELDQLLHASERGGNGKRAEAPATARSTRHAEDE